MLIPKKILSKQKVSEIKRNSYVIWAELKTLEWDILNPDLFINLEINNKRRTSIIFNLGIKKKVDEALILISTILKFSALSRAL